jgi:hypothetical protein
MNPKGRLENLVSAHPGNQNAVRSGVYSPRTLAPRAREIADALMAAPHTVPLDAIAADEIGAIVATLEAIDADLLARGLTNDKGDARSLLDLRIRMSGRLERWLREFGATPASRAEWAERVARGESMVALVRNELEKGRQLRERAVDRGDLEPRLSEEVRDGTGS